MAHSSAGFGEIALGQRSRYRHHHTFRHWASIALLVLTDIFAFSVASLLFRHGRSVPQLLFLPEHGAQRAPIDIFVVLAFAFIVVRYFAGDYTRRKLFWDGTRSIAITLFVVSLPSLLILIALPTQYSVVAVLGSWTFLLFAVPVFRQGARIAAKHAGIWRVPTALIASGSRVEDVYRTLNSTLSLGCDIKWLAIKDSDFVPPNGLDRPKLIEFGGPDELAARLYDEECDQAVVATDDMQSPGFADLIQRLMETGVSVSFIPSFRRLPLVGVATSYFFGKDIVLFQVRNRLQNYPSRVLKRVFDVVGAVCLLIVFSPLIVVSSIAIKLHDRGPIVYSQKRTGRSGRPFQCMKFRTMAPDADVRMQRWKDEQPELYEEFQKTFKLQNDPRITRPGRWLRSSSLDELPQLFNVLRGEMSLVGPRPVLESELIKYYGPAADLYKRVRPGLTGLWQVRGRSDTSYEERVVYDEWYILNWSFWYDIVILLQTVWVVLQRKGAY